MGQEAQRASLRTLARVLAALAGLAGLVWYIYSPFVDIDDIVVGGVVEADVTEALAEAGIDAGDPLLLAPTGRLERILSEDPWVAVAAVSRIVPGTLEISVVEHVAVLAAENESGVGLLALDGTVLSSDPLRPDDVPVFLGAPLVPEAGARVTDRALNGTLQFLEEFGPLSPLARFEVVDDELWLRLPSHDVRLGRPVDMAAKAASLRALLADDPPPGTVIVLIAPERPTLQNPAPASTEGLPDDESQGEVEG